MRASVDDFALREIRFGRVWRAKPFRRTDERDGVLVLWSPAGTPRYLPLDTHGREVRIPRSGPRSDRWALAKEITSHDSLWLVRYGARHTVSLFWRDGQFAYWYVNFERHIGRSATTLDYVDDKLDIVVDASGTARLKDEDELAKAAALGLLDEAAVRAEAGRVLADPPWPTGWEDFRPDPSWPIPQLPPGWDIV